MDRKQKYTFDMCLSIPIKDITQSLYPCEVYDREPQIKVLLSSFCVTYLYAKEIKPNSSQIWREAEVTKYSHFKRKTSNL